MNQESLIIEGDSADALTRLPDVSVQCILTSPPYWGLRDYGMDGQIGHEHTYQEYINRLVSVFKEARRVLADDGTFWLIIGDGYTSGNRRYRAPDKKYPVRTMSFRPDTPEGLKPKDLLGIPWRLALALQDDGWYLRCDVIWNKPNAMPESVKDRPTRSHEYIFLLSKKDKYFYNMEAVVEGNGKNQRSVWSINKQAYSEAHFATFPLELIKQCVLASTRPGDRVLDPFFGSGTVGVVCEGLNRSYVGIELNPEYVDMATSRLKLSPVQVLRVVSQ